MAMTFPPPYTAEDGVLAALRDDGYAVLSPAMVAAMAGMVPADIAGLQIGWDDLPLDGYLRDGGSYRRRRHSCFTVGGEGAQLAPHRAHWQSLDYNALHGGMERMYQPLSPILTGLPAWSRLLESLGALFSQVRAARPWYVEAHQFRIDTSDGIGRPTPEGAHRDGVDFVAVFVVERHGIKGGETRVFDAAGPDGHRFTLEDPWSLLLLDDTRVIHESTPIQPLAADAVGHRDTLVLTYRSGAFQGED
ncbi:2OG-Fe dioxygenase family protein [Luteimonas sp. MC1828]|uniref:2OG-Fe dioxygenase family protein n=1 Tax=Luteimonas sp. MC1828 TaxID=2799787 RepID=UPI0018F17420|nr:2OG-Fe dioxygenase family protein [Luteimonas sp. MC1828]MBJ7575079.1 2OG-Fe dioxygenase family protein [Luteimonas sp. MC1828]